MSVLRSALLLPFDRAKLVFSVVGFLVVGGAIAWFNMPREEDPKIRDRFGVMVLRFPGAEASAVERLVVEPLEESLSQVSEIKVLRTTARADAAIARFELADHVTDTDAAWDEVLRATNEARQVFPDGVEEPELDDAIITEQEAIVLAVTGSDDRYLLRQAAEKVQERLLRVPNVAQVELLSDPGEQITIEYDDALARRLGISGALLAQQLQARNQTVPVGAVRLGDRAGAVDARSEFASLDDIRETSVSMRGGAALQLGHLARVRIGAKEPASELLRVNGKTAVGVGVVPDPAIDVVVLGRELRAELDALTDELQPLTIETLSFQPDYVEARLSDLGQSLLLGIVIVALILILAMGIRLGALVASIVPMVALTSLAIYAMGGGVLQQLSVAALVLSLGLLVDNAIVVAEATQQYVDKGIPGREAAMKAACDLAFPLLTATGTTVAAFVPMLLSAGPTGEFTRAIPIVAILTISVSYLFAIMVTPALASRVLRPSRRQGSPRFARFVDTISHLGLRRPWLVVAAAVGVVGLAGLGATRIPASFFPQADRNQLIVEVFMGEGAHLSATDQTVARLDDFIGALDGVTLVASFIGRSAPSFYYNLPTYPQSPHFAHVLVTTEERSQVFSVRDAIREFAAEQLVEATVVPRFLEQGPPLNAPVEVRLYADDLESLYRATGPAMSAMRQVAGVRDVQQNLGVGRPTLRFRVDDATADASGASRSDIALGLLKQVRGIPVGTLRSGDEPIPIVVRSRSGEDTAFEDTVTADFATRQGSTSTMSEVAQRELRWKPASIHRRNQRRFATLSAHLDDGHAFGPAVAALTDTLPKVLPEGVTFDFGGAAEGAGNANAALAAAAPFGAVLLLLFIMIEFNSFRRLGIVLVTMPLAAAGVVPGLLLAGEPFGFMSLLGIFALLGIVVNNAIVLLSVVEEERAEGRSVQTALETAVKVRTRPILLTTATTVAGLFPLVLSTSPLWPPMASAMITGLLASTMLTLVVVPALYRLMFREAGESRSASATTRKVAAAGIAALMLVLTGAGTVAAQDSSVRSVSLDDVLQESMLRASVEAARDQAEGTRQGAKGSLRQAVAPSIGGEASHNWRDRDFILQTPVGDIPFAGRSVQTYSARLFQPIVRVADIRRARADSLEADAAMNSAVRTREVAAESASDLYLDALNLEAQSVATEALIKSLESRRAQVQALVDVGRAIEADLLRIDLSLDNAEQALVVFDQQGKVLRQALGQAIGSDEPVAPLPIAEDIDAYHSLVTTDEALQRRKDLVAIEQQRTAAIKRRKAVWTELVPNIDGSVGYVWTDGSPLVRQFFDTLLTLTWRPLEGGTRAARANAERARASALQHQLEETQRGLRVEVASARAAVEIAKGEFDVASRGIVDAEETVRVTGERFGTGNETINDLLIAEAQLRDRRARYQVAVNEIARANVRLAVALGALDEFTSERTNIQETASH